MSGKFYMLTNPYIEGDANKVFKAINSLEASKMAYEEISKYFNNSVHNFRFSLLKLKSDSVDEQNLKPNKFNLLQYGGGIENNKFNANNFSHFEVSEKITKNGEVDYSIKKYNGTINNTYNIIGLGHENLTEVFSRKEKMAILKNRFYCLPELVEYAHFNDKYPQFKKYSNY